MDVIGPRLSGASTKHVYFSTLNCGMLTRRIQRCNKEASLPVCLVFVTAIATRGSQFRYYVMAEGERKKRSRALTAPS